MPRQTGGGRGRRSSPLSGRAAGILKLDCAKDIFWIDRFEDTTRHHLVDGKTGLAVGAPRTAAVRHQNLRQ